MKVNRIYVEKKKGFDIGTVSLKKDIKDLLGINSVTDLRILNRYDVSHIDDEVFESSLTTVFSEPQVDTVIKELPKADHIFAVEYLPGQFDQRADSCRQCIQFITGKERPVVKTAFVYLINGNLSSKEMEEIKKYLINPVEAKEAILELPESIDLSYEEPEMVHVVKDFPRRAAPESEMKAFISNYSLAMDSLDLRELANYFESENRMPTMTELRVIDTYWSDHCRHTTFSTRLNRIDIRDRNVEKGWERYLKIRKELNRTKPIDLMDIATIGAGYLKKKGFLERLDESEEINACTVKTDVKVDGDIEKWLFFFKNETHNHPTEIEPFGGAATCIGGAIRDPLSGRAYVYQAMRVTGAADPTIPIRDTVQGKLPQRTIVKTAALGYSSYGNQIGLATGLVKEIYHKGYMAKRMEVGAVVGAAPQEHIVRLIPKEGDIVLLLGGKTGRDGCGGATGSSKSHNISSLEQCGAEVQKGNPPEERKLQRLFRNPKAAVMIKRCNDFGAGGVSVAIGELADGVTIYLDKVPKKYEGLDGTELAISESQERMAVVIEKEHMDAFIALAHQENIEATHVADITSQNRMIMYWKEEKIVDISRDFLNSNGAKKSIDVQVNPGQKPESLHKTGSSLKEDYIKLVSDLNICSQKGLVEMFDSTIGAGTVIFPYGGSCQKTPSQVMAARFPVLNAKTSTCSLMSYGFNPFISSENCYVGAYLAVVESIARLVAAGGDLKQSYLSFQEYFERLGEDKERWGKPVSSLIGALDAQLDLKIAAIGGKDSMSGSFENLHVPPTLISFAVSITEEDRLLSNEFKNAGNTVILLSPHYEDNGLPDRNSIRQYMENISEIIHSDMVKSASAIGYGGIAESVFKSCIGNGLGFEFNDEMNDPNIFNYRYGSFLVEIPSDKTDEISGLVGETVVLDLIGKISDPYRISAYLPIDKKGPDVKNEAERSKKKQEVDLKELEQAYCAPLEKVFPSKMEDNTKTPKLSYQAEHRKKYNRPVSAAKPKVLIPVFPGTNCEYDTAAAFEREGAKAEILIIMNRTAKDVHSSIEMMTKAMKNANILMIPGGFSGGDEPDGSGKFITSFLRNPEIAEEIDRLLNNRDGLIGGICNGFQALIKLGLLPYGKICEMTENSPTLAVNRIGRHQSSLVRTRIASNKSPWLSSANIDDIHLVAVSHGEGRFVCEDKLLNELIENGQIASQYTDFNGNPSMDISFNPNGSVMAIEGITSPDGRIFGKMGHTERMIPGLYRNVKAENTVESRIFRDAVRYFTT